MAAQVGQNKDEPGHRTRCWRAATSSIRSGKIGAIEAKGNNETGSIPFRADFPNPERLLRHGQTGTVLLSRVENAIVIPQRATFEVLQMRYVYVVDKDGVAHQRQIVIQNEMDDVFVIKKGLSVDDRIVLDGIRQVHDGEKVEYEFTVSPELVLANLKNKARRNSKPRPGTELHAPVRPNTRSRLERVT